MTKLLSPVNVKYIFGKIIKIFSLSFLVTLIIGSHVLAVFIGYAKGKSESAEEYLSYLENNKVSAVTPTPTILPQATPTKNPVVRLTESMR